MSTAEHPTQAAELREESDLPPDASRIDLPRRRFNVEEYHRMAEAGILSDEERVELIDGDVVVMSPIGDRHGGCVTYLTNVLAELLRGRALVSPQNPVRIGRFSEPQPDLAFVRPRPDYYRKGHPTPADVLFAVDVMDSSARKDRGVKVPLYARGGVPEVWLVDLKADAVEVHRRPAGDRYAESRIYGRGESFAPVAFPDVVLAVDDVLGE